MRGLRFDPKATELYSKLLDQRIKRRKEEHRELWKQLLRQLRVGHTKVPKTDAHDIIPLDDKDWRQISDSYESRLMKQLSEVKGELIDFIEDIVSRTLKRPKFIAALPAVASAALHAIITYDSMHAEASRRFLRYTVLTPQEVLTVGRCICNEYAWLLLTILRYKLGLDTVILRPHNSHITLMLRLDGRFYELDPSVGTWHREDEPIRTTILPNPGTVTGRYVTGPLTAEEFLVGHYGAVLVRRLYGEKQGAPVRVLEPMPSTAEQVLRMEYAAVENEDKQLAEAVRKQLEAGKGAKTVKYSDLRSNYGVRNGGASRRSGRRKKV